MRPLSLEVRAFRGFRAPFTLAFRPGIVLVEGANHDAPGAFESNGAGKSLAVVEAPMWALFDRTVRYGERAVTGEVAHPERGADVALTFQLGPHIYAARRTRALKGAPRFTLTQDGAPYPLSKDPSQAKRELAEILGFDYVSFRHAVVVQGGDSLASAGFAAQMGVLEMILRTFTLAKAADRASQAAVVAERALASAEGTLRATADALARAQATARQAEQVVREQPDPSDIAALLKAAEEAATGGEAYEVEVAEAQTALARAHELREQRGRVLRDTVMGADRATREALRRVTEARTALTSRACPVCQRPFDGSQDPASLQQTLTEAEAQHRQVAAAEQAKVAAAQAHDTQAAEGVKRIEGRLNILRELLHQVAASRQRAEVYRAQLDGMEHARRVAEAALDRARTAEQETADAAEAALAEAEVARVRAGQCRFWAKGFSRTDLQADLVAAATPVLNEAAAHHAQTLTAGQILVTFDPFRATTREDLVRIAGASAPSYAGLSRGEKERVDLVIALALRDLARWRLPEPVQFAVYDEVFDHMDEAGLRAVAGLLQADAARGATVIVVTHNLTFKALFPGAHVLHVTKRGGEATVRYTG